MGYTTEFTGQFNLDRTLTADHYRYLVKFSDTRRMARDPDECEGMPDRLRHKVGLPIGDEGGYFVGGTGTCGQDNDDSVIDQNEPPEGQPGLWCNWTPNDEGNSIVWNETEKFYYYTEWLQYIISHFLKPWGYLVNGKVDFQGEDSDDYGSIMVQDNIVMTTELIRGIIE